VTNTTGRECGDVFMRRVYFRSRVGVRIFSL